MKQITIICPGKIKDESQESLEQEYRKRLSLFSLEIVETKIANDQKELEGEDVLAKYRGRCKGRERPVILLQERGKLMDSRQFSSWLVQRLETQEQLFFIFGGAAGHGQNVLELPHESISLSPLTFPHKIARIILLEQLYRAQCIHLQHPYHK
jgi:23S rRNA (pseudouridine1915-N3)-methyltransferase